VKGYTVITSDERNAGQVVDEQGIYLIVEHGLLRKRRNPLPRAFAHADDAEQIVRVTVPSRVLRDAPALTDEPALAQHYGIAGWDPDPPTHGEGDILPADPARPAEDSAGTDRAPRREHLQPGEGPNDRGSSIGITGGDRFRDAG
jgi:hypothetical protein